MILKYRDIVKFLLKQSAGIMFERFDGTIAVTSVDDPGSVSRNITDAEVLVDDKKIAMWNVSYTPMSNLITSLDLYYKPITTINGGWSKLFCRFNDATQELSNFNTEGTTYSGYLGDAHDFINEERPLTIYAHGIRDANTAEFLAKKIIEWRFRTLPILQLTCKYSVANIEMFDKIGCTCTFLPSHLTSKFWIVTGHRIVLNILNQKPSIRVTLVKIGSSDLPTAEEWVDTYATGDAKTDTYSSGEIINEVY